MPRNIKIHDKSEEDLDLDISVGKSKNRIKSDAGLHYKTSASSLFLRDMARLINKISRRHTGNHLFVRNAQTASQRVIIKSRIVRHVSAQNGLKSLQDHCSYFTRKGVEGPDQKPPEIYNGPGTLDDRSLNDWLLKASADRHHFRFIVSPENSQQLDLTAYIRELVEQMENDLGTRLEYIAVNHFNTDTPHSHIIIRGVSDDGKDLVISRDYMSNGMRNRAREIANDHLGLRTELEIKNGITSEVERQAFTQLDRELKNISAKDPDRVINLRASSGREKGFAEFKRAVRIQRLKFLESMKLATEIKPGIWKLKDDFEQTLRELGMKNDIIKSMNKGLAAGNNQEKHIFDPTDSDRKSITGLVVERGIADELDDKKYLIVSATDNRLYYVPLSKESESHGMEAKPGAIVSISGAGTDHHFRVADKVIIDVAAANGGIYSAKQHRRQVNKYRLPEGVTVEKYLENYLKRLKALERRKLVERVGEESWRIPADLKKRLQDHGEKKVKVRLESADDLAKQIGSLSPTWLDREIAAGRLPCCEFEGSNFNRKLNRAKEQRIEALVQMGIAARTSGGISLRRDFLETMRKQRQRNDLKRVPADRDIER